MKTWKQFKRGDIRISTDSVAIDEKLYIKIQLDMFNSIIESMTAGMSEVDRGRVLAELLYILLAPHRKEFKLRVKKIRFPVDETTLPNTFKYQCQFYWFNKWWDFENWGGKVWYSNLASAEKWLVNFKKTGVIE